MGTSELLQAIISLLFVLALILVVAWAVKRWGFDKRWNLKPGTKARLEIIERLSIDPKRQLVLVRRDNQEHLLALGQNEVHVVETYEANATDH